MIHGALAGVISTYAPYPGIHGARAEIMAQITIIMSISVTIAMYCLIQLYMPIAGHLAPHKPLLKLFAVKAVGV